MARRLTPLKIAFLLLIGALLLWVFSYPQVGACAITHQTQIVRGDSLAGLIEAGTEIQVAYGYYSCHEPVRGDIIIYKDPGNTTPIIKQVRAVSGDTFALARAERGAKIVVNGRILLTSTGEPYRVSRKAYELLSLYERDYEGVIPSGAVLILGNIPTGSRDSTQFGLVGAHELVGKVVEIKPAE